MEFHDSSTTGRRRFLKTASLVAGAAATSVQNFCLASEDSSTSLVAEISHDVIFKGRKSGTTWFHPRACMVPSGDKTIALMTLQTIGGSDYFGHVHFTTSADMGKTWSKPAPIEGLGRTELDNGYFVGVCDVVPEYHPRTKTVLAMGHNVYYQKGRLAKQRARWPVYTVRSAEGKWSPPQKLDWDDQRGSAIYTCGCGQRATLPDGDILVPLSFGHQGRAQRSVAVMRCTFDGQRLAVGKVGNELTNTTGRGLLEPSIVSHDGHYLMTIRAEDSRGYVTNSEDGLTWKKQQPWTWDDGQPLTMSTTQQHWLTHSEALYLVYTRKDKQNVNVFRWRAPLFMAQVDMKKLQLIRETEREVLPLVGDGIDDSQHVARMGNFHTTTASPHESWVTVGETMPADGWSGNTLLGRVHWQRPNGEARGV